MPKKATPKGISLFSNLKETVEKPNVSTEKTNKSESKSKGRPKTETKNKSKNNLLTSPPKTTKPKTTPKNNQSKSEPTALERWHKSNNNPPAEFRPIEFNTNYKKPVRGFKIVGGYIVNTPYYLNKTNKANGYLEWKYISSCSTLDKCPNGFPDCENCDRRK